MGDTTHTEKLEAELRQVRERLLNAKPYGYLADQRVIRELKIRKNELEWLISRHA